MLAFGTTRLTSLSGTDDLKPLHGLPIMNFHDAFEAQSHFANFYPRVQRRTHRHPR